MLRLEKDRQSELGRRDWPSSLLELGLRGPTLGVLQRQGVLTVAQLLEMTPQQLMEMRRVGLSRMLEVRGALQAHGLDLQVSEEDIPTQSWQFVQRASLKCQVHGDCSIEIKTSAASSEPNAAIIEAFVEAHQGCGAVNGNKPSISQIETVLVNNGVGGSYASGRQKVTVPKSEDEE